MEGIQRLLHRPPPLPLAGKCCRAASFQKPIPVIRFQYKPVAKPQFSPPKSAIKVKKRGLSSSPTAPVRAGWFLGLGEKNKKKNTTDLSEIVKAGDPVLHEPAREVSAEEIGSERIQKIIDDMVKVMRGAPGVGLAAPQIGIPLKVSFYFTLNMEITHEPFMVNMETTHTTHSLLGWFRREEELR